MSGLRVRSGAIPYELNDEMWPPVGLGTETYPSVHVIETGPVVSRSLITIPSACEMATTGMCTAFGPVPVTLGLMRPVVLLYRTTPSAPALWAFTTLTLKVHVPRRIRTTRPVRSVVSGWHASAVLVEVPGRAIGELSESGEGGTPVTGMYPTARSSAEIVNFDTLMLVLSKLATPMTLLPTAGALAEYVPSPPLLPKEATTTIRLLTNRSAACAVGYCGHSNGSPTLMLSTSAPSASIRSIAVRRISVLVSPRQPNTRYAPNVTSGATPVTAPLAPMIPATCVPCPLQSSGIGSGWGVLAVGSGKLNATPTKSYPTSTRQPGPKQPPRTRRSKSTPVSNTATLIPLPQYPNPLWTTPAPVLTTAVAN